MLPWKSQNEGSLKPREEFQLDSQKIAKGLKVSELGA